MQASRYRQEEDEREQGVTARLRGMGRTSPTRGAGRYDMREINLRVERMRVACGLLAKQVASEVGLTEAQWSKKMTLKGSSFSIPELGRLADFFAKKTGRLLIGWPFIDPDMSDLLDSLRRK